MVVRLDKIYTKIGDKGTTRLIGGIEISKDSLQVECYGTLDELNCHLGMVRSLAPQYKDRNIYVLQETEQIFQILQNHLFDLGSILARPAVKDKKEEAITDKNYKDITPILARRTHFLEDRIDQYLKELEPLNSFVLPGGAILNGHVHVARAIARRFERLLVRWNKKNKIDHWILAYVNRLSDFLFVYARWVSKKLDEKEYLWEPGN